MTTGRGRYEVRYRFTRDELRELGAKLAGMVAEIADVEADKAAANKQYASTLESLKTQVMKLGRAINEGAEYREVECNVYFNHPRPGVKTLSWTDAGDGQEEVAMTPAEMQAPLFGDGNTQ